MIKKVYIRTLGCQMNVRDSEFAMGILLESGFAKAPSMDKADVVLFNSCSVRKHAEDKLFSNIAELKHLKSKKPGLVIGLIGCTAQAFKARALERSPMVDIVCGPGDEAGLPYIIKDVLKNRCPIIATGKVHQRRPELFPGYRQSAFKAYVSTGEGCNNFCSYCIVPYVRGRERSRGIKDIVKEVKDLASRGFKEVTLLGQNVNSYKGTGRGKGKGDFVRLLETLNKINGLERIRFMTSHPKDATADLFRAMAGLEKVCEHLHLPMQSGSNRILKLMNRGYSSSGYTRLAESYKKIVPGGTITTDVIVGFPSEKEKDFNRTLDLIKKIGFDGAFTFKYSPRPPARSAALKDDIPNDVKEARLKRLNDLQTGISGRKNLCLLGRAVGVLVDGCTGKIPSMMTGRTRTNKIVVFGGNKKLTGRVIDVKVEAVTPYALKGARA